MRLFDTDFLIGLVSGDEGAVRKAAQVDEEGGLNAISVVTTHEYLRGIFHLYSKDEKILREKLKKAEAELARFEILSYTYEIAKEAAKLDAKLIDEGIPLSLADVIIAATAVHYGLSVVTRNVDHFRRVPRLEVEIY